MDERIFLAACHGYLLCVYLLLFVWQNKISSSSYLFTFWRALKTVLCARY